MHKRNHVAYEYGRVRANFFAPTQLCGCQIDRNTSASAACLVQWPWPCCPATWARYLPLWPLYIWALYIMKCRGPIIWPSIQCGPLDGISCVWDVQCQPSCLAITLRVDANGEPAKARVGSKASVIACLRHQQCGTHVATHKKITCSPEA